MKRTIYNDLPLYLTIIAVCAVTAVVTFTWVVVEIVGTLSALNPYI